MNKWDEEKGLGEGGQGDDLRIELITITGQLRAVSVERMENSDYNREGERESILTTPLISIGGNYGRETGQGQLVEVGKTFPQRALGNPGFPLRDMPGVALMNDQHF